jgi:hypothetical protein
MIQHKTRSADLPISPKRMRNIRLLFIGSILLLGGLYYNTLVAEPGTFILYYPVLSAIVCGALSLIGIILFFLTFTAILKPFSEKAKNNIFLVGVLIAIASVFVMGYLVIDRNTSWFVDQIKNYGVTTEAIVTDVESAIQPSRRMTRECWCYVSFMVNNVKYEDRIELYPDEINLLHKNQKVRVTYSSRNPNLAILTDRLAMRKRYLE